MELYSKKQVQDAWFVGWLMGITAGFGGGWLFFSGNDAAFYNTVEAHVRALLGS